MEKETPTDSPLKVFEVKSVDSQSRARLGLYQTHHGAIETPQCLLYTRMGTPVNLPQDLLEPFELNTGIQIALQDLFLDTKAIEGYGKGVHGFVNTKHPIFLTVRDPSEFIEGTVSENFVTITNQSGRSKISTAEYMRILQHWKPDFAESLSIEVPAYIKTKRMRKSIDISLKFLDQSLQIERKGHEDDTSWESVLFGVIQGGMDQQLRKISAIETAKRPVRGFILGSFGLGENPTQRKELVAEIINHLPDGKARVMPGIGSPEEILEAVAGGVDFFTSNYPNMITEWGFALTFSLEDEQVAMKPFKINLLSKEFERAAEPILPHCQCYTCQRHTKAYLHHLFNTHEMLVSILLTIHNTWHYLRFFESIREHLRKGTFATWKDSFLKRME